MEHARIISREVAFEGEIYCGDMTFHQSLEDGFFMAVADGLGHGESAYQTVQPIYRFLQDNASSDVMALIKQIDQQIRPSQGAALALAYVDLQKAQLSFVGVGNINAYLIGENDQSFVSRDGMVGANMRTPKLQTIDLKAGDKLVMISDGIQNRFYSQGSREILLASPVELLEHLFQH